MQYTVRKAVDHLLRYLTPDERVIPPVDGTESEGRIESALYALNGGLQELYALSSDWLSTQSQGEILNAPTATNATLVKGSRVASLDTAASWMEGCTIRVTGSGNDNEILEISGTDINLRNPSTLTGTIACTVYHDCLILPANVRELNGTVLLPGIGEIRPANGEKDLRAKTYGHTSLNDSDYAFVPGDREEEVYSGAQPLGTPRYYWVDSVHSLTEGPRHRMKLMPMPNAEMIIEYRAEVSPPNYTIADVWVQDPESGNDPGVYIPAPNDFTESIIIPIVAQRFKSSPFFRNDSATAEITRQYEIAMQMMKETNPQPRKGVNILPPY